MARGSASERETEIERRERWVIAAALDPDATTARGAHRAQVPLRLGAPRDIMLARTASTHRDFHSWVSWHHALAGMALVFRR